MDYEFPGMTPTERRIFGRLTEDQKRDVHYEGWSAVWDDLTEGEKDAIEDDFFTYGDR